MKNQRYTSIKFFVIFALALLCFLVPCKIGMAYSVNSEQHIYDDAGLLTSKEISSLEKRIDKVKEKRNLDILIITSTDAGIYDTEIYVDEFKYQVVDEAKLFSEDSIYLYINLTTRDIQVSGYGACKKTIDDYDIDEIIEDITPDLTDGNYYTAIQTFVNDVKFYSGNDAFFYQTWFQLIVAFLLSILIVIIMAANHGSRVTTNANTYLDSTNSKLRIHHDNYIRTSVTKRRKPQSNGGSRGGGGGHFVGRGGSHSTGSGKF